MKKRPTRWSVLPIPTLPVNMTTAKASILLQKRLEKKQKKRSLKPRSIVDDWQPEW